MLKRLLLALVFVFLGIMLWYTYSIQPVNPNGNEIEFEVRQGEGVDSIGNHLSQEKLIRSRSAFKITVVRSGISSKIQAGYFRLSSKMSTTEIANKLTHATAKQIRVTIPEGLRREEIALILEKSFKEANPSTTFSAQEFMKNTVSLEGKLFPDTYDFDPKSDTGAVVNRLLSRFQEMITKLNIPSEDLNKVIIFASLLEREAGSTTEMPEIAGVLTNRLEANWPLQIDATVQYALTSIRCKKLDCDWWPRSFSRSDLQIKSSLNTYLYSGLPSSPISNPGYESLKAASNPVKTEYWFYLHDSKGQIHFSKTLEEHNRSVCLYLKKDC